MRKRAELYFLHPSQTGHLPLQTRKDVVEKIFGKSAKHIIPDKHSSSLEQFMMNCLFKRIQEGETTRVAVLGNESKDMLPIVRETCIFLSELCITDKSFRIEQRVGSGIWGPIGAEGASDRENEYMFRIKRVGSLGESLQEFILLDYFRRPMTAITQALTRCDYVLVVLAESDEDQMRKDLEMISKYEPLMVPLLRSASTISLEIPSSNHNRVKPKPVSPNKITTESFTEENSKISNLGSAKHKNSSIVGKKLRSTSPKGKFPLAKKSEGDAGKTLAGVLVRYQSNSKLPTQEPQKVAPALNNLADDLVYSPTISKQTPFISQVDPTKVKDRWAHNPVLSKLLSNDSPLILPPEAKKIDLRNRDINKDSILNLCNKIKRAGPESHYKTHEPIDMLLTPAPHVNSTSNPGADSGASDSKKVVQQNRGAPERIDKEIEELKHKVKASEDAREEYKAINDRLAKEVKELRNEFTSVITSLRSKEGTPKPLATKHTSSPPTLDFSKALSALHSPQNPIRHNHNRQTVLSGVSATPTKNQDFFKRKTEYLTSSPSPHFVEQVISRANIGPPVSGINVAGSPRSPGGSPHCTRACPRRNDNQNNEAEGLTRSYHLFSSIYPYYYTLLEFSIPVIQNLYFSLLKCLIKTFELTNKILINLQRKFDNFFKTTAKILNEIGAKDLAELSTQLANLEKTEYPTPVCSWSLPAALAGDECK